jgi:membrane protein required for colicin V production
MNALDAAVLVILGLSALFAFARGFVREALSIVAWVGAAAITLYGFAPVYAVAIRFMTTPLLADLAAGAGLFLGSLILLTIVTSIIAHRIHSSALSPIDRTLGLIFGLVRGAVLVSLAWLLLDVSVPPGDRPAWIKQAKSAPLLAQGAQMLRDVLPPSLRVGTAPAAENAQHALENAQEYDKAMHALTTPTAPVAPAGSPAPDYRQGDRREMNRLIDNAR